MNQYNSRNLGHFCNISNPFNPPGACTRLVTGIQGMDLKSVIKTFAEAWAAASLKMEQTGVGGNCPPLPPAVTPHPGFPSSPWDSLHRPFLPPWPPASPLLLPSSPFLPHLGLESLARLGREGWGSISTSQPGGGAGVSCSNFHNINSLAMWVM